MATYFRPLISAEDYKSIRELPNADFPDTHDKWLNFLDQHFQHHMMRGDQIKLVEVDFNEFSRFARDERANPNGQLAIRFASKKGM